MKKIVLDPSYLSSSISTGLLKWVQDVKLKLDAALLAAGVSSLKAGANIVFDPTTGLGDVTVSMVPQFGAGIPVSVSTEGQTYYNTTPVPYNGYIYHSGAWHRFS